jgi:nitrogen fixation protein FixH
MSEKQSAWKSPWVIAWVGILVAFVLVSGFRVYLAVQTNPGLVDENYYERGQDYEQNRLKKLARNPGWKMKLSEPQKIDIDKPGRFDFQVTDKAGAPVTPDSVTFYAYRSADAKRDFSLPMEAIGPGRYSAEVSFPLLGAWDILISVKNGEDEYNHPHWISAGVD